MPVRLKIGHVLFYAGLLVLPFAFFFSILAGVGTIGEEWRTVGILQANPNNYWPCVWNSVCLGILPTAVGLALCVFGVAMLRHDPPWILANPLLLIIAVFLFLWGIFYLGINYSSYSVAVVKANARGAANIIYSLQMVYSGYEWLGVLWSITGVFLSAASVYAMREHEMSVKDEILSMFTKRPKSFSA